MSNISAEKRCKAVCRHCGNLGCCTCDYCCNLIECDCRSSALRTASWVIRERSTGRVIMETFNEHLTETIKPEYEMVPIGRYLASLNTTSRPVMNPPAQAEAGNRVHAAPGQADRDATSRGKTAPSSRPEARPVMRTEQQRERDEEIRCAGAEQYWKDKQGDEYGSY